MIIRGFLLRDPTLVKPKSVYRNDLVTNLNSLSCLHMTPMCLLMFLGSNLRTIFGFTKQFIINYFPVVQGAGLYLYI